MKALRILLIGQPNVGKSSLLNALVGPRVTVSNYPGTTVEVASARKKVNGTEIEFIDTPGIYSISDRSEEEKVAKKTLFEEEIDGVIVVADSTSLERSLYLALQILEAEVPTIIALNFAEDAEKKGIKIDCEKLKEFLNICIVSVNPLTRKGISEILNMAVRIGQERRRNFRVRYDDHIEKVVKEISTKIESKLPGRFVALRVLEGDEDFYKYLRNKEMIEKVRKALERYHPEVAEDIAITRYGTASLIAREVTRIVSLRRKERFEEKVDRVLLHKIWGPFITVLFLLSVFGALLYLGNLMQGILMGLANKFSSSIGTLQYSIVGIVLIQGLTGLTAGISIAIPYVFLFYLLLGLLEDAGLLSRFIVSIGMFLEKIGLSARSFIPLALGLGCTVPATVATRVLSSKSQQLHAASLLAFVPCSSRIAIIMGIVGFYGGKVLAFSVFATLLVAGLIWAFGIKRIIHIKSEPLLLELPPYRRPLVKNVLVKSWIRMKDFVYIVVPLLVIGGMIYSILDVVGLTNSIVEPFSFITGWLGLPNVIIIPLVFGFLQKDLTGGMLTSVLGGDISMVLTSLQIYTFGVASTIGIPCVNALGMLIKEFGFKKAISLTAISIAYSLLLAGLLWKVISFW